MKVVSTDMVRPPSKTFYCNRFILKRKNPYKDLILAINISRRFSLLVMCIVTDQCYRQDRLTK